MPILLKRIEKEEIVVKKLDPKESAVMAPVAIDSMEICLY